MWAKNRTSLVIGVLLCINLLVACFNKSASAEKEKHRLDSVALADSLSNVELVRQKHVADSLSKLPDSLVSAPQK